MSDDDGDEEEDENDDDDDDDDDVENYVDEDEISIFIMHTH